MNSLRSLPEIFRNELYDFSTIGILGFGREGISTYKAIRKYCHDKHIIIADRNPHSVNLPEIYNDKDTDTVCGDNYFDSLNRADIVFVSPGISLIDIKIPPSTKLTSQTDFIFRVYGEKIIAVTGSKGKSTTAALSAHVLKQHFSSVPLAGNIGIPPFDVLDELEASQVAVFEVSSHQLQHVKSAPQVALLLNLFPEHLDYYSDTESYFNAKRRIFQFQSEEDCIILNNDESLVYELGIKSKAVKLYYSLNKHDKKGAWLENGKLFCRQNVVSEVISADEILLKGLHNISNCLAAVCIAAYYGMKSAEIAEGLRTFTGLPHRLECILAHSGKIFYNDSIATIPEASWAAIEALSPVSVLILGGMDRGLEYEDFIEKLLNSKLKNICFYGIAGKRMFEMFSQKSNGIRAAYYSDFKDCVVHAVTLTKPGEICLLSPAASSYDQFRNFEERGETFRQIVRNT